MGARVPQRTHRTPGGTIMTTPINPLLRPLAVVAALVIFPACEGESLPDAPTSPSPADQTPAPVASLTLSTGQVVEVYELGDRALLSETGIAGLPPVLDSMGETSADKLVELWQRLAPDRAVPASVVGLQQRLLTRTGPDLARPPKVRLAPEIAGLEMPEQPVDAPEGTLAAPVGCYNGCCDYEWLRT